MIRALLGACGPVLSWKRVSTFGFCEFASPEAALRCVRLLHERALADKKLLARTDGKMQALVDTYKSELMTDFSGYQENTTIQSRSTSVFPVQLKKINVILNLFVYSY